MRGKDLLVPLSERKKKVCFWFGAKKKVCTGGEKYPPPHVSSGLPLSLTFWCWYTCITWQWCGFPTMYRVVVKELGSLLLH